MSKELNYEIKALNYEAVLADIDARIATLQTARESILELMAMSRVKPIGDQLLLDPKSPK